MSSTNDFIKKIEKHEDGVSRLDSSELSWYNGLVKGTIATGELRLKDQLEDYYQEHLKKKSVKTVQIWSAVGIAAILVIGGFYLSTIQSSSGSIQLQTNDAPIYSDSATYDTTQNKVEKKYEDDVDE